MQELLNNLLLVAPRVKRHKTLTMAEFFPDSVLVTRASLKRLHLLAKDISGEPGDGGDSTPESAAVE